MPTSCRLSSRHQGLAGEQAHREVAFLQVEPKRLVECLKIEGKRLVALGIDHVQRASRPLTDVGARIRYKGEIVAA